MFNVATRIFEITWVAHTVFGLDSTGWMNPARDCSSWQNLPCTRADSLPGTLMVIVLDTFPA